MKLEHLFSPVTINGMTLKNRAVMPPMGTGYGNADGTVGERLIRYLARRALGGTGLIITEVCAVDPRGKGFPNEIGVWSDEFIPGLTLLTQAIHGENGKIALQLHHAGRETFEAAAGGMPEAPSPIPSAVLGQPCQEMSRERIAEMIDAFGRAAARAKRAGFDAVEIHGAHGYLLNQFLSPFSNQRTDEYGGSEENRSRFVLAIVAAVREAVGHGFPVIIRVSTDEMIRGGYDLEFMKRLAPRLVAAGVDAIHASLGVYSTPGNLSIASMDTEAGFNLFRARAIKEVVSVPVIGVGRINDPRVADRAIALGDADLISFGRQHLTDPDFIRKAAGGPFRGDPLVRRLQPGLHRTVDLRNEIGHLYLQPRLRERIQRGADPGGGGEAALGDRGGTGRAFRRPGRSRPGVRGRTLRKGDRSGRSAPVGRTSAPQEELPRLGGLVRPPDGKVPGEDPLRPDGDRGDVEGEKTGCRHPLGPAAAPKKGVHGVGGLVGPQDGKTVGEDPL